MQWKRSSHQLWAKLIWWSDNVRGPQWRYIVVRESIFVRSLCVILCQFSWAKKKKIELFFYFYQYIIYLQPSWYRQWQKSWSELGNCSPFGFWAPKEQQFEQLPCSARLRWYSYSHENKGNVEINFWKPHSAEFTFAIVQKSFAT